MDRLEKLKLNKTFKELDFIKSDLDYKAEVLASAESEFLESVNKTLLDHPQLKIGYDKKQQAEYDELIEQRIDEINDLKTKEIESIENENEEDESDVDIDEPINDEVEDIVENETILKNPKLKKLYRKIAKITHPDKIKDLNLNNLYVTATDAYDNDEINVIYSICNKLNIDYEIEPTDLVLIRTNLDDFKGQIQMIEGSYPWQWFNGNENLKTKLVMAYIKQRIS